MKIKGDKLCFCVIKDVVWVVVSGRFSKIARSGCTDMSIVVYVPTSGLVPSIHVIIRRGIENRDVKNTLYI